MKLSLTGRIVLTALCFGIAFVGFMVKLPGVLRHHDTELHTLFYFLAAGFLNVLFVKRNVAGHVLVFVLLYGMGVGVEYAQEYSNSFGQRIHGNYDPEDIRANLKGLVGFSVLWVVYLIVWYATRSKPFTTTKPGTQPMPAGLADEEGPGHTIDNKASSYDFADPRDEQRIQSAIQMLTEVMNRNPGHPALTQLGITISELKEKINLT